MDRIIRIMDMMMDLKSLLSLYPCVHYIDNKMRINNFNLPLDKNKIMTYTCNTY